jgi:hypothetical protein
VGTGLVWLLIAFGAVFSFAFHDPWTQIIAVDVQTCGQLPDLVLNPTKPDVTTAACDHTPTVQTIQAAQRDALSDARDNALRVGLAPIGLGAAYLSLRRTRATEHATDDQAYTKAIDQIAEDQQIAVRIGGVFALENLATRSPTRYAATVYQVLFAYLEHMTAPTATDPEATGPDPEATGPDPEAKQIAADLDVVLDVLRRHRVLFDRWSQPVDETSPRS